MADTGKNAIKTWTQTGGGGDTFLIDFPYLAQSHVIVALDAGGVGSFVVQARPDDYVFNGEGTHIEFVVTPTSGDVIRFTRATPHPDLLVPLADGVPVTAADLVTLAKQAIYYTEEVEDQL